MQNKISSNALARSVLILFIFTSMFITACGRASQSSTTSDSTATSTPSNIPFSPIVQATHGATATTVTQGKVTIAASQTTYRTNDTITITITNGLSESIFVTPYYTNCTPVRLEKEVQSNWMVLGNCTREQMAHAVAIPAGTSTQLQLSPHVNVPRPNASTQWQAGVYRASLTYNTTSPDPDTYNPQGTVIQSTTFTVM